MIARLLRWLFAPLLRRLERELCAMEADLGEAYARWDRVTC